MSQLDDPEDSDEENYPPTHPVAPAVQRFFQWYGSVIERKEPQPFPFVTQSSADEDSNPFDLSKKMKSLSLSSNETETKHKDVKLQWIEGESLPWPNTQRKQTTVVPITD